MRQGGIARAGPVGWVQRSETHLEVSWSGVPFNSFILRPVMLSHCGV